MIGKKSETNPQRKQRGVGKTVLGEEKAIPKSETND